MPDSPCLARLRTIFAAIEARQLGTTVSSAGAKGRSVSYASSNLDDLIRFYRQLAAKCPDFAASDLPVLDDPAATTVARGCLRPRVITR